MKIIIENENFNEKKDYFIRVVLPEYLLLKFKDIVDRQRLVAIDREFNINSYNILVYALQNLQVYTANDQMYIITVNKSLKLRGNSIERYLQQINSGNLSVAGYPIIYKLFEETTEKIDTLYERWKYGYSIL